MVGTPTPNDADPTGQDYAFEKGTQKTGGGGGFADVWRRGRFAGEYKGKRKDLTAAYNQLLLYREALEKPTQPRSGARGGRRRRGGLS